MTSLRRAVLASALALASCAEDQGPQVQPPPPPPAPPVAVVASPPSTDTVMAFPVQGLVIEVRDPAGAILPDVTVRFTPVPTTRNGGPVQSMAVAAPDGQLATTVALNTNERGRVTALVRFGPVAGAAGIEVTVPELGVADTVAFTVTPGQAASVRLEPRDTSIALGSTLAIRGGVVDQFGNLRPDPITYTAVETPASIGSVSAAGLVTAAGFGRIKVAGAAGAGSDTVSVSIVPTGTVAGLDPNSGRLVRMNLDGSGREDITSAPINPGQDFEPAWSRDGSAIVFTTHTSLRVVTVATGAILDLQVSPQPYWPAFSPDGHRIFYSVYTGAARIASVKRDGSDELFYTAGSFDSRVSFAPDGKSFIHHTGELTLRIHNLQTNSALPFTRHGIFPEWSPAGDRIVYFTSANELRIMNADGSDDQSLAPSGYYPVGQTSWSPDGRWLLLRRNGYELLGIADEIRGMVVGTAVDLAGAIWRP